MRRGGARDLVELLGRRAGRTPERLLYTFLDDGEREGGRLTCGELDRRARALALALREEGVAAGERVALLFPPGLDFAAAFFGCLCAGAVAVPAPAPGSGRRERTLPRVLAILRDAAPRAVVTTAAIREELAALGPPGMRWLVLPDSATDPGPWRPLPPGPEALACLQYTSGSTAAPKGVMLRHGSLLANLESIRRAWGYTPQSVAVAWVPHFHDDGLVHGLLQPLFAGFTCHLLPAAAFVQRPARWLQAVSRRRASHSGGPNFAYELALRKVTAEQSAELDLSCWQMAYDAAETVRAETLERFAERFAPCGFRRRALFPSYGLAEATLLVSTRRRRARGPAVLPVDAALLDGGGRAVRAAAGTPRSRALVGCGPAAHGVEIAVVEPNTAVRLEPGRVGEVWVRGAGVAAGYWQRPEETARTFAARLATGEGPWLRTGDLGFLAGGELFVTGRQKDLIVIRGQNHAPEDIEWTAGRCHPALRPGCAAAFSIDDGEERLVVAAEVGRGVDAAGAGPVLAALREAVLKRHELRVHALALLAGGTLPKTSSGKVQRHACRAAFLAGGLEAVAVWREAPAAEGEPAGPGGPAARRARDIERWLAAELARRAGAPAGGIDRQAPFARFGLDSHQAVELTGRLADWLGRPLPATLLYEHPTVARLAAHLAGEPEAAPPRRRRGRRPPEPIAIVGLGCRFPGAPDPESFWRLLWEGRDAVREVPAERWDAAAWYDPDPAAPGRTHSRWLGALDQVDLFDAAFFGLSPREAARLDPQQRLLLEVAWEAMEDAGVPADRLAGREVGVFVGLSTQEYSWLQAADPGRLDAHWATGTGASLAANRLSYLFDLRGPSLAVDTACSSSLVAVDLACRSLWRGESELALAGGASLVLSPAYSINFTKAGALSAAGRCRAFDAGADGYVRGEGAGLVVLEPLARALAAGRPVVAVIRGSAVNQDGRTNGLMAPSRQAQERVLREAWRQAGLPPRRAGYVEAHGTGTLLGDPIEAAALGAVFGAGRPAGRPCALGSVKTNLGHLEAAAGIAGLIKTALALERRTIPASLHFEAPNPHIPFDALGLAVQRQRGPWPAGEGPARAGVSSFGFGGTNAHVVLEEPPARPGGGPGAPAEEGGAHLLALSAGSPAALRDRALALCDFLAAAGAPPLADVCHTAGARRCHHPHRLALAARSRQEAAGRLSAFLDGGLPALAAAGQAPAAGPPRLAFVFAGQGAQWPGMARDLLAREPVFRHAVERCDGFFRPRAGWSLLAALAGEDGGPRFSATAAAQPLLFALQVGLAELWRSWGVTPDAVAGHSAGEVAAAWVAGALELEEAVEVIFQRGRVMERAAGRDGEMAAVALPRGEAELLVAASGLAVAAVNGPAAVVLSGPAAELRGLLADLERRQVACRTLDVGYAFHSSAMAPLQGELAAALAGLRSRAPAVPLISTVTGRAAGAGELDAGYWARGIREPVLFAAAAGELLAAGCSLFVEVGPHPVLGRAVAECAGQRDCAVAASLRRWQDGRAVMLAAAGGLWARGRSLQWEAVAPGRCVRLPLHPWQRRRFWLDSGRDGSPRSGVPLGLPAAPAAGPAVAPPAVAPAPSEPAARGSGDLAALVRREAAALLEMAPEELEEQRGFFELGMDSLLAVELRNRLQSRLGRALPPTLPFDRPTIAALARFLAQEAGGDGTSAAEGAAGGAPPPRTPPPAMALPPPAPGAGEAGEAVAVIGLHGRFPGGAEDPGTFWRHLHEGRDAITEVPADRWDAAGLYDPDPEAAGKAATRWGGFLAGVDGFDAQFFGISPREAAAMDPQQRLLLETGWNALESAGIPPDRLAGSATGVFLGLSSEDYSRRHLRSGDLGRIDPYSGTGTLFSVAAGRISYLLGLQGPSLAVDTACSSSLVAVHLAVRSLRSRECDLALAGGAQLMLSPEWTVYASRLGAMAADGRCKTFDAAADGYVRGEGCGMVVLKRLADALADGDPVLAVIRGSAVNHDGRSSGLTVPNGEAQRAVLRTALADARIAPAEVGYVEAHGTGTRLGDPIEALALGAELGAGRPPGRPLWIGSVKTNIGHLEAAAGVAGLIKAVLALCHGEIPPHLHFRHPNPAVPWHELPLAVPTRPTPWPEGRRVAGVSSFGAGGTNAHLVLEAAPPPVCRSSGAEPGAACLLPLSARSGAALAELARAFRDLLAGGAGEWPLGDLCAAAALRRSHHRHRLAVTGRSRQEIAAALDAFLAGRSAADFAAAGGDGAPAELGALARRYVEGGSVEWRDLFPAGAPAVPLPLYPWQRQRHWLAPAAPPRDAVPDPPPVPLLGRRLDSPLRERQYESRLGGQDAPWLADHRLRGEGGAQRVVPAAHHLALALAAAAEASPVEGCELADVRFPRALALADGASRSVQVVVAPEDPEAFSWRVFSRGDGAAPEPGWVCHAAGRLRTAGPGSGGVREVDREAARQVTSGAALYRDFQAAGYELGPAFQWIEEAWSGGGEVLGRLRPPRPEERAAGGRLHPGLLDACFQLLALARPAGPAAAADGALYVPAGLARLHFHRPPATDGALWCHARLAAGGGDGRALRGELRLTDQAGAAVVEVTGLELEPAPAALLLGREAAPPDVAGWLCGLEWQPRELPPPAAGAPERWLILADRGGVGRSLARRLEEAGHEAVLAWQKPAAGEPFALPAAAPGAPPLCGAVYLWGLDAADAEEPPPAAAAALDGALALLQALAGEPAFPPPRLWIATRRAVAVGAETAPLALAQAPLWGFGRAAALEHPELWGGLVDLDAGDADAAAADLLAALAAGGGGDQTAFRRRQAHAPRLARAAAPAPDAALGVEGTYLITGGLGALGLEVARWLAARGAGRLVLAGRRPPSAAAAAAVAELARTVPVETAEADVARRDEVAALLDRLRSSGPPLRGVVHAAGMLDDGVLLRQDRHRFAAVLAPKVAGAWHLHRLTEGLPLAHFVLFSSAAALLGSPGQAGYAAANAFLDLLAHHRRALGLPAVSLGWGPWAGGGMAAGHERRWQASGLAPIPPQRGLEALDLALRLGAAQVAVLPLEGPRPAGRTVSRLLADFAGGPAASTDGGAARTALRRELEAAPAARRAGLLQSHLRAQLLAVLGLGEECAVEPRQGFFELGMDSLAAVGLRNRLQADFGLPLPATLALDHPNLEELAGYLAAALLPPAPAGDRPAAVRGPLTEAEVRGLSAAEAEASIAELLERLDARAAGSWSAGPR